MSDVLEKACKQTEEIFVENIKSVMAKQDRWVK